MQKIALIGLGYIGNSHASAIVESDKVELTAIVEKNEELGKNAIIDENNQIIMVDKFFLSVVAVYTSSIL